MPKNIFGKDNLNEINTRTFISRQLDTVGDGTGTKNANLDFSVTPGIFLIKPPINQTFIISRLIFSINTTINNIKTQDYGDIVGGVTNGLVIRLTRNGKIIQNLTNGANIKTNHDFSDFMYDVFYGGAGIGGSNGYISARWSFHKSGTYIKLRGVGNDTLEILCQDNYSTLIDHAFIVQGFLE